MPKVIISLMIISLILGISVNTQAGELQDDCRALVDKAVQMFSQDERKAITYTNSADQLVLGRGAVYVFALDMDNIMLCHPYHGNIGKKLNGKSMQDWKDKNGNYLFREFLAVAKSDAGEGWVEYFWWRPGEQDQSLKKSFVKKVPGKDIYVGAGYYPRNQPEKTALK